MRRSFTFALVAFSLGCSEESSAPLAEPGEDAGSDAGFDAVDLDATSEPEVPEHIADRKFGPFEPWAKPIEDYLAVGESVQPDVFSAGIHDLAPFGGRMFIGYGDANYNLGEHIAIEMRCFVSPDDPKAQTLEIDGAGQGAPQTAPTQSGEEQIDRYRELDGVLWQAGIDSIDADELHTQANTDPKSIEGNVYRLQGDTWRKFRSVVGGEHVHDLAVFEGDVYSVGSGADTRTEFEAGQIFRYLWRSTDQGASFETVERVMHPQPTEGDSRWVHLLPTTDALYLFGYQSDFFTQAATVKNASYDGQTVTPIYAGNDLATLFPDGTLALPDGTGLVWGVDVALSPARYTANAIAGNGSVSALASLDGLRLVDASWIAETQEVLFLAFVGDAYGEPAPASVEVVVLGAPLAEPGTAVELIRFTSKLAPISLAYFGGSLFLGTGDGQVLRSTLSR